MEGNTHPRCRAHERVATAVAHAEGQEHPIKLYLVVWAWLFILSTCSYLVDYFGLHGYLRWSLILIFMMLKAGLIVAVFMHMAWERLALIYAIILPPIVVLVFVAMMVLEADYTRLLRMMFFASRRSGKLICTVMPREGGASSNPCQQSVPTMPATEYWIIRLRG